MSAMGQSTLTLTQVAKEPLKAEEGSHLPSFRTLLACTDLSPASRRALEKAGQICRLAGARLLLLHVSQTGPFSARPGDGKEDLAEEFCLSDRKLEQYAEELRRSGVVVERLLEDGTPADVILRCMDDRNVDLVILGTHGMVGKERLFCGSTAEEVLRKAHRPVMTVGPRAARNEGEKMGPVIFATDFHASSTEAVRYAAALAETTNAPLHCLHVLPLAIEVEGRAPIIPHVMTEALRHLLAQKQITLKDVHCTVAYGSDVSRAIVEYADAHDAQAIILGVQRASWLAVHMAPHITYRIIVTAPCPVLTTSLEAEPYHLQAVACL